MSRFFVQAEMPQHDYKRMNEYVNNECHCFHVKGQTMDNYETIFTTNQYGNKQKSEFIQQNTTTSLWNYKLDSSNDTESPITYYTMLQLYFKNSSKQKKKTMENKGFYPFLYQK